MPKVPNCLKIVAVHLSLTCARSCKTKCIDEKKTFPEDFCLPRTRDFVASDEPTECDALERGFLKMENGKRRLDRTREHQSKKDENIVVCVKRDDFFVCERDRER